MLLMVASSHTVVPATNAASLRQRARPAADRRGGQNPLLFVVNAKMPAKTLPSSSLAKASPGNNYASPGAASQNHLVVELFSQAAGIRLQHIPYRGGAPAIMATVAGDAELTVISPLASLPQIEAGNLRALAAGSLARDRQFPDLPTIAEQGFPGFEAIQWVGLLTTSGTPRAIVERLNGEVNRALRDPDVLAKLAAQGISPAGGSAEDFQATIAREIRKWTEVARAANIKVE